MSFLSWYNKLWDFIYLFILPAERWPYDPEAAEDPLDPLTKETKEGEKRIMEFISNESEYGEQERARFLLARAFTLALGLAKRASATTKIWRN